MGRKLDLLLGRSASRQLQELKSLLGLALSRLAVLRHRRQVLCDQARGDVSQLLQLGHVDHALLRVEQVINHQNMLDVFAMLEHYCHLLTERTVLLDHRECPEELREPIASLIFAASRCGELPEMVKIRGIFSSKYGREFVAAAVELRNRCGVNPKMIQKLSTRPPILEVKQRVTKEIAAEKGIKLDFHDPAEGDSDANSTMDALEEQLRSEETTPARNHAHQKYKDVAGAAQAAFESAAVAAAAARAAVELCRWESQGKGSDDDEGKDGSPQRSAIKESMVMERTSLTSKNLEEGIHHDRNHDGSDAEGGIKTKQIYSSSDSSDDEDTMNSSEQASAGFRGKKILLDGSEDGSPGRHRSSYLHRPEGSGYETRYGEESKKNSFDRDMNKEGLRSGAAGINIATYDNAENTTDKMQQPHLRLDRKPISVRTRRGHW